MGRSCQPLPPTACGLASRRRAHVHHFTQYMEASHFDVAHEALRQVETEYEQIQRAEVPAEQQQLVEQLNY